MAVSSAETVEIDIPPRALDARPVAELKVFVSCGSRPGEMETGRWFYETFKRSHRVVPFLWEQESPGAVPSRTLQERLLERARSSDGVIGILHYRGASERELFSLASYDEISAAAATEVPTLVFRTPSVPLTGMVLPHQEVRAIRRVSESLPYLEGWVASVRPRSPLWTLQVLPMDVKSFPFGKWHSGLLVCMPGELERPAEVESLRGSAIPFKVEALSHAFLEVLERHLQINEFARFPFERVGLTKGAVRELNRLHIPWRREQEDG